MSLHYDDLENLLAQSRLAQENPLIVIIDPIDDRETIQRKINTFSCLNYKFQMLSDETSFQIYGFNVRNMYNILLNQLNTEEDGREEADENNAVLLGESTELKTITIAENVESAARGSADFIRHAFVTGNALDMAKFYTHNWYPTVAKESVLAAVAVGNPEATYRSIQEINITVPLYTNEHLYTQFGINFSMDKNTSYLHQLKEAMREYNSNPCEETENKVLSLGWNYNIPVNEDSSILSKRVMKWLVEQHEVYDIREFAENDIESTEESPEICPVYAVMTDSLIAISLNSNLIPLFLLTPEGVQRTEVLPTGNVNVFVTFVRRGADIDMNTPGAKFNFVYDTFLPSKMIKPDYDKIQAAKFISGIITLMNTRDIENNDHYNSYLAYDGDIESYDPARSEKMVDILVSHLDELFEKNGLVGEGAEYFKKKLIPTVI